jgi:hypothetical protein
VVAYSLVAGIIAVTGDIMKKLGIRTFMVLSLVHCKEEEVDPLLATVEILDHKENIDPYGRGETHKRDINVTVKNNHSKKLTHISLLAQWYYPDGEVEESRGSGLLYDLEPGQTAEILVEAVNIPEAVVKYSIEVDYVTDH